MSTVRWLSPHEELVITERTHAGEGWNAGQRGAFPFVARMRSKAIKLDVQFAEAKACGRLDRKFAVTTLALLRQTCATHTQKELLASIADSLEELIFSRVPSFEGARPLTPGASSGGEYEGLAWFELCKRAEEEKREEALAKEALLLERQQVARPTDSCCTPNLRCV